MPRILSAVALLCLATTAAAAAERTAKTWTMIGGDAVTIKKLDGPGAVRITGTGVMDVSMLLPLDDDSSSSDTNVASTNSAGAESAAFTTARTTTVDLASAPAGADAGAQTTAVMKAMGSSSPRMGLFETPVVVKALSKDPLPFALTYAPKGKNPANKEDLVVLILQSTSAFNLTGSTISVDAVVKEKGATLAVTDGIVEALNESIDAKKVRAKLTGETTTSAPVPKANQDKTSGFFFSIDSDVPMPKN